MLFKNRFPKESIIWKYSDPRKAQENAFKYFGRKAVLYQSNRPDKKYMIMTPEGKAVHFGQLGYEDFTYHHDLERRHNYLTRTAGMRGDWRENRYSPNNLSREILW